MSYSPSNSSGFDHLAERGGAKADHAFEVARQFTDDTLNGAKSRIDDFAHDAPAALSRAAARIEGLAQRTLERVTQVSNQVRDQTQRTGQATVGYIKEEPVKSLLIAATAGVAAGALIAWLSRSRRLHSSRGLRG